MEELLQEKIAGEVTLSPEPGRTLRKWREIFGISQTDLADHIDVSPSVISDYESGRRKSPGTTTVKKIVESMLAVDLERGGNVVRAYDNLGMPVGANRAILAIRELPVPTTVQALAEALHAKVVVNEDRTDRKLHGYTLIDSIKAITTMNSFDYLKLYGWSSERALVFSGIQYGRSPMVAVRVHPMKPAAVVYHQPEKVDELAVKLAEADGLPLLVTQLDLDDLKDRLEGI